MCQEDNRLWRAIMLDLYRGVVKVSTRQFGRD
jgi:hypothetical protein